MTIVGHLRARPRTFIAAAIIVAVALALPWQWRSSLRFLVAWNTGVLFYLVAAWIMMARSDISQMRRRAALQDEGAMVILVVTCVAAIASMVAIVAEMQASKVSGQDRQAFDLVLAVLTVVSSWFLVHTTFALHYAHEFYGDEGEAGGLEFPQGRDRSRKAVPPFQADYWDFAYFSANISAAAQTSDVQVTSPGLRRLVLAHTLFAFFFNTMILALGINVAAGLIGD